jgi:hypothetical protein
LAGAPGFPAKKIDLFQAFERTSLSYLPEMTGTTVWYDNQDDNFLYDACGLTSIMRVAISA